MFRMSAAEFQRSKVSTKVRFAADIVIRFILSLITVLMSDEFT